jgi:hypothetical protein
LRRGDGAAATGQGGIQRKHTGIHVHRVHLGQQLPGLHGVAHIDQHPQYPA